MESFADIVKWYNNKDVVPTVEALVTMLAFYHDNGMDFSKLGCMLPKLANHVRHQSTSDNFYRFRDQDRDLDEIIRSKIEELLSSRAMRNLE